MNKLKKLIADNFPAYSYAVLPVVLLTHALVWGVTKTVTKNLPATDVTLPIDAMIPLRPEWVVIYVLTFVFWAAGLVVVMRQREELCHKMTAGILIAEVICCFFFIALPSCVVRPEINVAGPFSWALSIIYTTDTPTNCFPSMHCLFAYMVFRQSLKSEVGPRWRIFSGVFAALVCLSTLFVKQHVVVDVVSGIFFGEVAYLMGMLLPLWKIFNKINKITLAKCFPM